MKLESLIDTILELEKNYLSTADVSKEKWEIILKRANFLKQPLTLGMFVACDLDGNMLEQPEDYDKYLEIEECKLDNPNQIGWSLEECNLGLPRMCKEYQQAQERVLFKGFEFSKPFEYSERFHTVTNGDIKLQWDSNEFNFFMHCGFCIESLLTEKKYNLELTPNAIKQLK